MSMAYDHLNKVGRPWLTSLILVCVVVLLSSCASVRKFERSHIDYRLGDRSIRIHRIVSSDTGLVLFNMHEDENTSVKAGKKYLKRNPGRLFYLQHSGKRRIEFQVNEVYYSIDPNRIFTDNGIEQTLKRSGNYSEKAHKMVSVFARKLLDLIEVDDQKVVIALHNNDESEYSLLSYVKGGKYEMDAIEVNHVLEKDADDFFFVTNPEIFLALKQSDWNVVLQDNAHGTDDGSLSIYCGNHNIPYVNLEAQNGHKKEQLAMFNALHSTLSNKTLGE